MIFARRIYIFLIIGLIVPAALQASGLADHIIELPTWKEYVRVLTLQDYNTRVVMIGATFLGLASGLVGSLLMLRKRTLMGDAISHATLPGIGMAFLFMVAFGGTGKNLLGLLTGATITGVLGMLSVVAIVRYTRLKDDVALAVVLSGFFAVGIVMLGFASRQTTGAAAGLEAYIYGKTASMLFVDAVAIGVTSVVVAVLCGLLFKEFSLLCFDQNFAASQGWPVHFLDLLLMSLIVIITVVGLQAVGLILVVALLIIPPASARFWTHKLGKMMIISGLVGATSCMVGCAISALVEKLPAGAIIVLTTSLAFTISLLFGTDRGLIRKVYRHHRMERKVALQHLLREMLEAAESEGLEDNLEYCYVSGKRLLAARSWSMFKLYTTIRIARALGLITTCRIPDSYILTPAGAEDAFRIVRNHRLWEKYLIKYADIAPSHVDRDADMIEHILDSNMIEELNGMLDDDDIAKRLPASPHVIGPLDGNS